MAVFFAKIIFFLKRHKGLLCGATKMTCLQHCFSAIPTTIYSSTSANRSLAVISLGTQEEREPLDSPLGVTKVRTPPLVIPLISINSVFRSKRRCSLDLVMKNGISENFISTKWMILSARWMTRSICAPFRKSSCLGINNLFLFLFLHV